MKKTHIIIFVSVLIAIVCDVTVGVYIWKELKHTAYVTRTESALGTITTSLTIELDWYYKRHKQYPQTLDQIQIGLSDGATQDLLNTFSYSSDKDTCRFTYQKPSTSGSPTTITEEFEKGQKIREVRERNGHRDVWERPTSPPKPPS